MVNVPQGLINDMHASMHAQRIQLTASISMWKLSTHCIAMANIVAYRA